MTRPSQNTDRRLIQAAIALVPETGFAGLKLRQVAQKAGVNLGMFNYHFKNKAEFSRRVMEEFYERFYSRLTLETAKGHDPEEQLRNALATLAKYIRENRKLLLALGRDVLDNHQPTVRFVEDNFHRHIIMLLDLIKRNKQTGRFSKNVPLPIMAAFLAVSLVGPNFIAAVLEQIKLKPQYDWLKKIIIPLMLSDRAIGMRLDLAFKGLAPDEPSAAVRKKIRRAESASKETVSQLSQREE
jgi:AcrR family transcriptional regulator